QHDDSAVGRVDLVARGARWPVHEVAVLDAGLFRAALEVVANLGLVEEARRDRHLVRRTDVDVVREAVAEPIASELAAHDGELACGGAEDAVLPVIKARVDDAQAGPLRADASAVLVRHRRAVKLDAVDDHIGTLDHPDALTRGVAAVREQARASTRAAD